MEKMAIIGLQKGHLEMVKSQWKDREFWNQGSHRFEKYLNLEGFLEKSLKIKSKSTGKSLKSHKSPWILLFL